MRAPMPHLSLHGSSEDFKAHIYLNSSPDVSVVYTKELGIQLWFSRTPAPAAVSLHIARRILYQGLEEGVLPKDQVLAALAQIRQVTRPDRRDRVEELWDLYCTESPEGNEKLDSEIKRALTLTQRLYLR